MTSSTVPAFQPKSGMRFVTLLTLVALAHVLVIVLILAHFGWLNGVGPEIDDNVGQSGIVIPVTLETAEDKENSPEEKVEPSEESTPEQAPSSPETPPSVEPIAETPSQSTTEVEKEIPLAAEPEAEAEAEAKAEAKAKAKAKAKADADAEAQPQAKPNVAPPATPTTNDPSVRGTRGNSNSGSNNAALTNTVDDSPPIIPAQVDPNYLHRPNPVYPPVSKRLREEGTVLLRVSLDTTGAVLDVAVQTTSTYQRLDQAAIEAVRQWRFIPASRGQQPVASTVLVPIEFKHQ